MQCYAAQASRAQWFVVQREHKKWPEQREGGRDWLQRPQNDFVEETMKVGDNHVTGWVDSNAKTYSQNVMEICFLGKINVLKSSLKLNLQEKTGKVKSTTLCLS